MRVVAGHNDVAVASPVTAKRVSIIPSAQHRFDEEARRLQHPTLTTWPVPRLFSGEEVRALDRCAIERHGIAGIRLMRRAGEAAFAVLEGRWPGIDSITVFCGAGNNAGDGYVVAGLARDRRLDVQVIQIGEGARLGGDAKTARDWALARGIQPEEVSDTPGAIRGRLVVDALLGTGMSGAPRPAYAAAIASINEARRPVLALDLPSGIAAGTGHAAGLAVRADMTVTFIGAKRGLFTAHGVDCAGLVVYDDLDVPRAVFDAASGIEALAWSRLTSRVPSRSRNAHKNQSGHVLCIGGERGMGGAVAMAAEAALRTGAGLVSAATRAVHVPAILARRPEIMVLGVDEPHELDALLERATVIGVGPGIGRTEWSEGLLARALASGKPMVVDADALNLLAGNPDLRVPPGSVLTPHPGEAARLLGRSTAHVQADRFAAAGELARLRGAVVVLKGAGSVIATPSGVAGLCLDGNPGLATAGTGDVLTGVVAGLLAQGLDARAAASLGACLHAAAGDRVAVRPGPRGMVATDVIDAIPALLNGAG